MQETQSSLENGVLISADQTLRLHRASIRALESIVMSMRINHTEIPTLAVLHRRGTIGIEHVTLIEDGLSDLLDPRQVHDSTISSACTIRSNACSHVGIPLRTLYS